MSEDVGDLLGRYVLVNLCLEKLGDLVPIPSEVEQPADSRMNFAVADRDKPVPGGRVDVRFTDLPGADNPVPVFQLAGVSSLQKERRRIVEFGQIDAAVFQHF